MRPANATWKALAVTTAALLLVLALPLGAPSGHHPADKTNVAASSIEILSAPLTEGSSSQEITVLSTTMRTSSTTDLLFHLTLECSLWTQITTIGNDHAESVATVKLWIELDGQPVQVDAQDTGPEAGRVVFCDRAHKQVTSGFGNENASIEQHLRTRAAHGFNWAALDVGNGIHTIEVKAVLEAHVTNMGEAMSGIGKRTLIIEPTKMATGSTL